MTEDLNPSPKNDAALEITQDTSNDKKSGPAAKKMMSENHIDQLKLLLLVRVEDY